MRIFIGISACFLIIGVWLLKDYLQYRKERKEESQSGAGCWLDEDGEPIEEDTQDEEVPDSKKQS